jgi:hypothetical protein
VGPRAGLDTQARGKILEPRSPGRPARSQTLYRLSYPAPCIEKCGYGNLHHLSYVSPIRLHTILGVRNFTKVVHMCVDRL